MPLKEFRRLDLNAVEAGVSIHTLMANAGKALAEAARSDGKVVLLCGKGNNGGDGFAAAGVLLRWGVDAHVVLLEARKNIGDLPRRFLDLLPDERIHEWGPDRRAWKDAAVVVDCMLGSGIRGKPRSPYDQAIRWLNKHAGSKLACDIPSGLGTGLAVRPDATVTFHAEKEGMAGASGTITVADIGIPKRAQGDVGLGDLDAGFVRPQTGGHKGDHGRVLVIGGGPYAGAPHYAGMGALRAGADLVHLAVPSPTAATVASWGPDLIVHAVGEGHVAEPDVPRLVAWAEQADALVLGPGMGHESGSLAAVREVLDSTEMPVVVDADALRALDERVLKRHGPRLLLTPHAAEFKRLANRAPTTSSVAAFADEQGVVVLAKGAVDLVSDGMTTRSCRRGHPTMTVGGTGDVLAGVCGALLAKGADRLDAACAAAYLVGRAGEVAASLRSYGATATDIHEAIPSVLLSLG